MTTHLPPAQEFSHKRALRAGFASFVGTAIEFYDFYVYATAAALVFPALFFPEGDPFLAVLSSFGIYAVGFFARPFGAIVFGHIGDRLGRRLSLMLTLVLMGVGTALVGVLPTYALVGIWAPILLVILRIAQGLAIGGEWGGAVLMSVENAPDKYKGFYGSFPQLGNPMGALLAAGIFSLLTIGGDDFLMNGGWRIPFLLSIVLIGVGFWVRYAVEETPVFQEEAKRWKEEGVKPELPLKIAIKNNWRQMLLAMGLIPISTGGYYIVTTFATSYATDPGISDINMPENTFLNVLSIAALCELISTLFIGALSDRIGRKRTFAIALVGTSLLAIPMFLSLEGDQLWLVFLLFAAVRVVMNGTWAPMASVLSQMFAPDSRQTSLSFSYSLGNAIWAGLSPLVATALYGLTGSIWSVIGMLAAMAALSLVCLAFAPQRKDYIFDPKTVAVPTPDEQTPDVQK
ncbi:MFS transporter [Gulosibacter chungangensis]|uniref:Putative proline/betaine transporter n=1 Tax=Gulosibacter chungangensis TaxID=979746 RepID=A0A7J5BC94_9MICO|nr:MFS transporter [Gulosibacter chungangensis]KAB1642561.1 MHS family MFS transporter [Gulosibacter chungangensis]